MEKGTLKIVKGDATEPQLTADNEIAVIPHVCNNAGGFSKGFVLALSKKFGNEPKYAYRRQIEKFADQKERLGNTSFVTVNRGKIIIANMIAQNGYISTNNPRPLRYNALVKCMEEVVKYINKQKEYDEICGKEFKYCIHTCKFGSELAGGNFNFIICLIQDIWIETGINVTIYEYNK